VRAARPTEARSRWSGRPTRRARLAASFGAGDGRDAQTFGNVSAEFPLAVSISVIVARHTGLALASSSQQRQDYRSHRVTPSRARST